MALNNKVWLDSHKIGSPFRLTRLQRAGIRELKNMTLVWCGIGSTIGISFN